MKTISAFLLAALCTGGAFAQPGNTVPKNIRAANTLENLADAEGLTSFDDIYSIPLEPGNVVGNAYLNPVWKRTTFMLYASDKMIEGYLSRYEIDRDHFEIRSSAGVKVLNGNHVKSFVWIDSISKAPQYFVNGRDFTDEQKRKLSGFYEVLSEGRLTLLIKTDVAVRKATYNQAFDVGKRDTEIVKKTKFFYIENEMVKELPSSKKKILTLFGDHAEVAEDFLNKNKLSLNEAAHLRALFDHYNAQTVTK